MQVRQATRGQNKHNFKAQPFTLTKSLLLASCIIENSLDSPKYLKILMGLNESECKGSQHKAFYASLLQLIWLLAMLDCNRFMFVPCFFLHCRYVAYPLLCRKALQSSAGESSSYKSLKIIDLMELQMYHCSKV